MLKGLFILTVLVAYSSAACDPACTGTELCVLSTCIATNHGGRDASWEIRLNVDNPLEPDFDDSLSAFENVMRGGPDNRWLHLHRGSPGVTSSPVRVEFVSGTNRLDGDPGIQLMFIMGRERKPLTGWLSYPYDFTLDVDTHPNFDTDFPEDGIMHMSVLIQGGDPTDFVPYPLFVHVRRPGFTASSWVPVGIDEPNYPDDGGNSRSAYSPDPVYVDFNARNFRGYPLNPEVEPFVPGPPLLNPDLYIEQVSPRSELFEGTQMWWDDPAHETPDGFLPFVRAWPPKHDEDHRSLRVLDRHERFPVKDGPRSVGWVSSYISGQVNSRGWFYFAETQGRVGIIFPDGEIYTVAGWVTDPQKNPVWYKKQTELVRNNQVLRGQWVDGAHPDEEGGFHTPLDIAIDPEDDMVFYVPGFEDHCIWKVQINDLSANDVEVSVWAGSIDHTPGFDDGVGTAATFDGPTSIVFDPVCDCMYVSDQNNGMIRKITRDRTVSTILGEGNTKFSGQIEYPMGPQVIHDNCHPSPGFWRQDCAKEHANVETNAGTKPDILVPHCIRVDSSGNIILLEHGFGTIRKINPTTWETRILAHVDMKHREWTRGWAWMDVDRWGNSGGLDSIYWCKFVGEVFYASHGPNRGDPGCDTMWKDISCSEDSPSTCNADALHRCEAGKTTNMFSETYGWVPPDNTDGKSYLAFNQDWSGHPQFGHPTTVNPPHYPWLVAVDPRGAVYFGGGGTNGLLRMRVKRDDDPTAVDSSTSWDHYYNYWNGRRLWIDGHPSANYGDGPLEPSIGPNSLFGYDAHNHLGLEDAWGHVEDSDEELLDTFMVPQSIRDDTSAVSKVLAYLRAASGTTSGVQPPITTFTPGQMPAMWPDAPTACGSAPVAANAVVGSLSGCAGSPIGATCTLTCTAGFASSGDFECLESGTWSSQSCSPGGSGAGSEASGTGTEGTTGGSDGTGDSTTDASSPTGVSSASSLAASALAVLSATVAALM